MSAERPLITVSAIPDHLWTAKETARYLGIHEKTLYRWIRTRSFPCVYVGTRLRFDPSDVLRWISARKEGG